MTTPETHAEQAVRSNPLLGATVDEFHARLRQQTVGAIILGLMVGWVFPQVGIGFIAASIILWVNRVWGDANCPYQETPNNAVTGSEARP